MPGSVVALGYCLRFGKSDDGWFLLHWR
jgi:hypothetical protein